MAAGRRVKRLREMVEQIQRLPASDERDRLLEEVRSRAVDVDTGVTPRAMLPLREPALPPDASEPAKRDSAASVTRKVPQPQAPAVTLAIPVAVASRFPDGGDGSSPPWASEMLSLGDTLQLSPLPPVQGRGGRAVPPWTLGLRG